MESHYVKSAEYEKGKKEPVDMRTAVDVV